MKQRALLLTLIVVTAAATLAAQSGNGHRDLSGTWLFSIDLPPIALKRTTGGATTVKGIDASGRRPAAAAVAGALPFTAAPVYTPEFRAKVKDLFDHESKTDPVFYCGRP